MTVLPVPPGGLLFRCEACPNAFCEDCLPEEHMMLGECDHFKALGQVRTYGCSVGQVSMGT